MTAKQITKQSGHVTTEGDELYYEVRGRGQPLLMIPGGMGDGGTYAPVADILSDEYKVITYDRRANACSTMNAPQNFEISQQSRDAVAVLHAAGEQSAFVFGNSSGAVIALDMAKTHPQAVRAVVSHEPPIARMHPKARRWQRLFAGVYWMALWFDGPPAMFWFYFRLIIPGLPIRQLINVQAAARYEKNGQEQGNERRISSKGASDFFVKQELLSVANYLSDVSRIKKNGVRIFMATGKMSLERKRFYAETAPILAEKLGCEMIIFPGHHISFLFTPDEFAAVLRSVLQKAEGANQ